jgi:hypothetical protein
MVLAAAQTIALALLFRMELVLALAPAQPLKEERLLNLAAMALALAAVRKIVQALQFTMEPVLALDLAPAQPLKEKILLNLAAMALAAARKTVHLRPPKMAPAPGRVTATVSRLDQVMDLAPVAARVQAAAQVGLVNLEVPMKDLQVPAEAAPKSRLFNDLPQDELREIIFLNLRIPLSEVLDHLTIDQVAFAVPALFQVLVSNQGA